MMARRAAWALALLLAIPSHAFAATGPASTRALIERMTRTGRAEAAVVVTVQAAGESAAGRRGTLSLEAPDRLRLDYAVGGERLTARRDGGEWLQPGLRQMLTMTPAQAQQAAALWDVLNGRAREDQSEQQVAPSTWRVTVPRDGEAPDTLLVTLGANRLPVRIETQVGDLHWTIRLSKWRFAAPKGRAAFVLRAPAGYEVIEMP